MAIVDDVATTGGSSLQAVDAVEAMGCKVAMVIVVLDRLEGAAAGVCCPRVAVSPAPDDPRPRHRAVSAAELSAKPAVEIAGIADSLPPHEAGRPTGWSHAMETSLHRSLKDRYASGEDHRREVSIAGFRVDAIDDSGRLIEIQSGALGPLCAKLRRLLPDIAFGSSSRSCSAGELSARRVTEVRSSRCAEARSEAH